MCVCAMVVFLTPARPWHPQTRARAKFTSRYGNPETTEILSAAHENSNMLTAEWDTARCGWWTSQTQAEWKQIQVFISSTFRDMHGERDVLTRHVFPEVNARLKSRRVTLVPVDLRWGLTNEDTSDAGLGALEMCLQEVERSRPVCIVLLGERCECVRSGVCTPVNADRTLVCRWVVSTYIQTHRS